MDNHVKEFKKYKSLEMLKFLNFSHEDLLSYAAKLLVYQDELVETNEYLVELLSNVEKVLHIFSGKFNKDSQELRLKMLEYMSEADNELAKTIVKGVNIQKQLQGKKAARARLARDPKQSALKEIENLYKNQKSQFKRYGYTAQFVRDMHAKYPIITDSKTIEKLVARLNKENEEIPR